ncbi:P1 family peptidase [Thermomonas sp.]|uniref:DmpA family aminopeptidase n=1 Tax=Thermomonas sp. TaxID=1971895 RepID=UPI0035B43157
MRPLMHRFGAAFAVAVLSLSAATVSAQDARVRARDLGIAPGIFATGEHNAITDVEGVRVGHATVREGDTIRTGVTAILPHVGNAYLSRVPAAIHVGNGFGKLAGSTQVAELGELETPILLTCTLCVWKAADAMAEWMLRQPGMEKVQSINPVVGETNDGGLNDIRARPITAAHVRQALEGAQGGAVAEGSVGAGTGTVAFGWKGGIGTSSRKLPASLGGWTVGVLVQSNYGGVLQMGGVPVGRELGQYAFKNAVADAQVDARESLARWSRGPADDRGDGSVIVVIATDAPLSDRNLRRLASRAMMGLGRTGSSASNGSGDYAIAFSTASEVRRAFGSERLRSEELANDQTSALFQAGVDAVEEAVYNSLLMATTETGNGTTVKAIPLDELRRVLRKHGVSPPGRNQD